MATLPAPEDMTDEQLEQLLAGEEVTLKEEGEKDPPEGTPPADPKKDDEDPKEGEEGDEPKDPAPKNDDDPKDPGQAKDPSNEEDPKPPSRREQLRVQQLLEKVKQNEGKTPDAPTLPKALNYKDELEADDDTLDKLQQDRQKYGEELYRQGRQESENIMWRTRLDIDAPRIESKYPFLDPHSDKFNEARADTINRRYMQFVGFDGTNVKHPSVRYSDFVEAEIEFAKELAQEEIAAATTNLKRQASQTGLRPGVNSAPKLNLNKAPEDMSDEELKKFLATNIPKS